jgi:hypothetical protein
MRSITLGVVATAAMFASDGVALAAEKCTSRAVAGVYLLKTNNPSVCVLELSSTGEITESRCYDSELLTSLGILEGQLSVSPSCRMSGQVTQTVGDQQINFEFRARGEIVDGLLRVTGTARSPESKLKIEAAQQW